MMMIVPCIVLAAAGAMAVKPIPFDQQSMQEFVDYINSAQSLFKADIPTMSLKQIESRLMDPRYLELNDKTLLRKAPIEFAAGQNDIVIPKSFDAREHWPNCRSIQLVRDQGNCGSCWAIAAASVMSDRLCIASGQKIQTLLSATDLLACCKACRRSNDPCEGGDREEAYKYMISRGICSGGSYGQKNVCKPYAFPPCAHTVQEEGKYECKDGETLAIPECTKKCLQGYEKTYDEDRVYGKDYYLIDASETEIQKEIMTSGPVQATFVPHLDFGTYKSGIYKAVLNHRTNPVLYPHTIKIIGWGVEKKGDKEMKYWLISNSWGPEWGENGFFRIVRGENHCQIESQVFAGHMKLP